MLHTLDIQNVSCGGCAATIRTALDLAGFTSVKVEIRHLPHSVTAEVEDDEHIELFKTVLRGHGYPLVDDEVDLPDITKIDFA